MSELKPCKYCGGTPQFDKFYYETAFGDRPFVCFRCTKCHKRTSASMCHEGRENEYREELAVLWNRGCY
jgi:hypothetical protein